MSHRSGPWFNIKMQSYQCMKSHCGDKTVVRSSYLHNGISYTGKMSSLYWIGALSVCCPCWFRIWQLNCQNNFLASGSAGGISMKIATKFNIVGSILVWYMYINTFLARAIIKLTVFHCRFATMSPQMRETEHGGCRIASPARAVRALFRLESWATRAGEVDRGTSASSRMTGSAPR